MKNNVSCLLLASALLVSACQKNGTQSEITALSSVAKEVIQSPTIIGMRQAYALLSIEEKQALWTEKFSTILKNDGEKLSPSQSSIVKELQSFLHENGMSKIHSDPTLGEQFIKGRLVMYKQHFSEAELFMLIECPYFNSTFSIFDSKSVVVSLNNNERKHISTSIANSVAPDCTCYYSISCSGSGNSCEDKKNNCVKKPECGLFGSSNCTGRCTNDVNPT
jgi:hypothetical protein